ncbi:hypothetical protein M8037_13930, partial [Sinorhizobium meliloti]|nr:hypothetical protein [Sinorhizobium meliloti]
MLGGEHKYTPAPHSGGGGSMPSAVQPDRPIFETEEGQDTTYPVSRNDSVAIKGLRSAMQTNELSEYTINTKVNCLYNFSRWLLNNQRLGFADRLDSASLDRDLKAYQSTGGSSSVASALYYLTNWKRGGLLPAARSVLTPHPDDATFIDKFKEDLNNAYTAAPEHALDSETTVPTYANALRHFSHYLRQNGKPGIVAQIGGRSLDADLKSYIAVNPGWRAGTLIRALAHFGTHLRPPAIGPEIAPAADPENAVAMRVGDGSVPGATEF